MQTICTCNFRLSPLPARKEEPLFILGTGQSGHTPRVACGPARRLPQGAQLNCAVDLHHFKTSTVIRSYKSVPPLFKTKELFVLVANSSLVGITERFSVECRK